MPDAATQSEPSHASNSEQGARVEAIDDLINIGETGATNDGELLVARYLGVVATLAHEMWNASGPSTGRPSLRS